jgi:hypothetical protein
MSEIRCAYIVCFPFFSAADCGLMSAMNQHGGSVTAVETRARFVRRETQVTGL